MAIITIKPYISPSGKDIVHIELRIGSRHIGFYQIPKGETLEIITPELTDDTIKPIKINQCKQ